MEPLVAKMSSEEDQHFDIPGEKTVSELLSIVENHYSKFLDINFLIKYLRARKIHKMLKIFY